MTVLLPPRARRWIRWRLSGKRRVARADRPLRVLALNPGSSSLKTMVLDGETVRASHPIPGWAGRPPRNGLRDLMRRYEPVDAVAIRFVHGGERPGPVLLDDGELAELEALAPRAPLHQPQSVALARTMRSLAPDVPVLACFDTSFHVGLPEHAARYALPQPWVGRPELRRAGFHGLSCEYATGRAADLLPVTARPLRLVIAHVGSGVSVTTVNGGRSVDTSMGFTPIDGAVMATRSGSLDPGLMLHLLRDGTKPAILEAALTQHAGLAGLTGGSGDMRKVLAARAAGDPEAATAVAVYLHRLRREIAAAAASLDAVDALVLTGGVAEGSAPLRAELVAGLGVLGLGLDRRRNGGASGDAVLSAPGEGPAVLLIHAREDLQLARGAARLMDSARQPAAASGERGR